MSSFSQDGNLPHGSIDDITIIETNESYTVESFQRSEGSTVIERMHNDGVGAASKAVPTFTTANMTVQLDSASTPLKVNDTFEYANSGWYVSENGRTFSINESYLQTATVRKCQNPLITNPGTVAETTLALTQSTAITAIACSAVGPESGLTYTWSLTGAPAGLSINSSTGEITGTPTTVSTGTFTINCATTTSDGYARSGQRSVSYTVAAAST